MYNLIPQKLIRLAQSLQKPLYVVGGACRDFIAGLKGENCDWDICAPVRAEEFSAAAERAGFKVSAVFKNTGTVRMSADGYDFEYACFRTDRYVRGEHSPAEVYFTEDITADACRRDFKCNAVYYDIKARDFVDPLGGIEEIKNGVISTVVAAEKVFGEDGLRLMRLCRIAAQTGFTPSKECVDGARKNRAMLNDIAAERVWAELSALLCADIKYGVAQAQYAGLCIMRDTGVLATLLPELAAGEGMEQRADFHSHDVLEHTLRCVRYAPVNIRLAALLHDVGKPYCKNVFGKFAGHETEGERIAGEICARLKAPKRVAERACALVRWHMYDLSGATSPNKVRKFIVRHLDILDDLLALKQADYSACKDDLSVAPCVKRWRNIYSEMLSAGLPLTIKQLAVRGDELIGVGICPDETAKTLDFLLCECVTGNVPNEKERLIKHARARRV